MHISVEFCQPGHFDGSTCIVGSVCREYPCITVGGVQEHELVHDLCVPGPNVSACDGHFPMIRVSLISNDEAREDKEVWELESHGTETRNKK